MDVADLSSYFDTDGPVLLKGAGVHWPLVQRARQGVDALAAYLLSYYNGQPVVAYSAPPRTGGLFFYNDDLGGMNFSAARADLATVLAQVMASLDDPQADAIYVGSTDLHTFFPGLSVDNGLDPGNPVFDGVNPTASIWIGNRTIAAAHYDMSNNIACCMAGRRRFTLFPPDQVGNLYPGPLSPTPGGQVVSMVDFRAPDFERHPRFREALDAGQVAEMEPGDVLLYPALWWHQVEALDPFNILVNYWWNRAPAFLDSPQTTLLHALLSLRDRPDHEKLGWRALFDHYVFGDAGTAAAHLPRRAQGPLGPLDEVEARRLRALILNRLNR